MRLTIHKNHHRPRWWFFLLYPWVAYKRKSMTREVYFDFNCKYKLIANGTDPNADDLDVNKLFGFGYFWNKKESARFGWNYNNDTGKIAVFAYWHVNGVRDFKKVCEVLIGVKYLMILNVHTSSYSFSVVNMRNGLSVGNEMIAKSHNKKLSYNLGFYFGGNEVAPGDVTIEINKL